MWSLIFVPSALPPTSLKTASPVLQGPTDKQGPHVNLNATPLAKLMDSITDPKFKSSRHVIHFILSQLWQHCRTSFFLSVSVWVCACPGTCVCTYMWVCCVVCVIAKSAFSPEFDYLMSTTQPCWPFLWKSRPKRVYAASIKYNTLYHTSLLSLFSCLPVCGWSSRCCDWWMKWRQQQLFAATVSAVNVVKRSRSEHMLQMFDSSNN